MWTLSVTTKEHCQFSNTHIQYSGLLILMCISTHNALPYSESSYLITNVDISMSLLNYCQMIIAVHPSQHYGRS